MKAQTLFASVFALAFLEGCDSPTMPIAPDYCAGILAVSGILVSVVDSASGVPIGNAVTATAIDGRYFEALTTPDLPAYVSRPLSLLVGKGGRYDVYVSKAGYVPWAGRGVVVKQGVCVPEQVRVTAKLQKAG